MTLQQRFGTFPRWCAGAIAVAWMVAPTSALSGTTATGEGTPATAQAPASPPKASHPTHYRPVTLSRKAKQHFQAAWGVDGLRVTRVASGNLVRFSYRVTDPVQAAALVDKVAAPLLYSQRAHATLSVPVMDKVGALRQASTLKAGQEYWVAFSNKGNLVKSGDRVDVIVGQFRADGLVVQ